MTQSWDVDVGEFRSRRHVSLREHEVDSAPQQAWLFLSAVIFVLVVTFSASVSFFLQQDQFCKWSDKHEHLRVQGQSSNAVETVSCVL